MVYLNGGIWGLSFGEGMIMAEGVVCKASFWEIVFCGQ